MFTLYTLNFEHVYKPQQKLTVYGTHDSVIFHWEQYLQQNYYRLKMHYLQT